MTLPASGAISLNDVNVELGYAGTTLISLNDTEVRALAEVPTGAISMSDLHGKSAINVHIDGGSWIHSVYIPDDWVQASLYIRTDGTIDGYKEYSGGPPTWTYEWQYWIDPRPPDSGYEIKVHRNSSGSRD